MATIPPESSSVTSSPGLPKPGRHNPLIIAFFTIFLDLLGFGIMIPIQAFYVQDFGATPAVVTLLGGSYSLMQFLFAHFWGRLSDRVGRRPIILSSVAISALGHFVFAMAGSLPLLFLARMIAGFGNANLGTAQAIISDSTTPENRAKGMGLIGAAFGLGFIFGPALGGVLGQISPTLPSYVAGGLAIANFVFAFFMLPETLKPGALAKRPSRFSPAAFRGAAKYLNIKEIFWISLIYTIGFALMEQVVGLLIEATWVIPSSVNVSGDLASQLPSAAGHARIGEAAKLTAYFLVVVGVTATLIQGGLIGRLSKAFGEVKLIRTGLAILTATFILVPLITEIKNYPLMLISAAFMACGSGIFSPSQSSLLSRSAGASEQGTVLGLNQSLSALGRVIGPAMAGFLFEVRPGLPFYVAAVLLFVAFGFALKLKTPPGGSAGMSHH